MWSYILRNLGQRLLNTIALKHMAKFFSQEHIEIWKKQMSEEAWYIVFIECLFINAVYDKILKATVFKSYQ